MFSSDFPRNSYLFKHKQLKSIKRINNIPVEDKEVKVTKEKPIGQSAIIRNIYIKEKLELRKYIKKIMDKKLFRLYVDLDGVLVDFVQGYVDFTGKKPEEIDPFWQPIKDNVSFWSNLNWMPDGKRLWDFIKDYNPIILSSPLKDTASKKGKEKWVRRNLGKIPLILETNKYHYASPENILVDDMLKNITKWQHNSGIGILHKNAVDTIYRLKNIL